MVTLSQINKRLNDLDKQFSEIATLVEKYETENPKEYQKKVDLNEVERAINGLQSFADWANTEEGPDYWADVVHNLKKYQETV